MVGQALLEPLGAADLTGAAVRPQGACTEQTGIGPGQGLLEHPAITSAPQLGSTATGRGKAAIEADRQHQLEAHTWAASA